MIKRLGHFSNSGWPSVLHTFPLAGMGACPPRKFFKIGTLLEASSYFAWLLYC